MDMIATFGKSDGTVSCERSLAAIVEDIRTGLYKEDIQRIRNISDKRARARAKFSQLPAFRPGSHYLKEIPPGRWTNVLRENFDGNYGLSVLDWDDVENPDELMAACIADPACAMAFISPSGNGIKAVFAHQPVETYEEYRQVKKHINVPFRKLADPACFSNASLGCFISYDPDLYFNLHPVPREVIIPESSKKKLKTEHSVTLRPIYADSPLMDKILVAILPFLKIKSYTDYFRVGSALAGLNRPDLWIAVLEMTDWEAYGRPYDRDEAILDYEIYSQNHADRTEEGKPCCGLGTLMWMARSEGFDDPEILMLYGGLL